MRIIFMGTPDFAVATLQRLVENDFEVVAVITAPDKPVGRGQKMSESPVKKFALEKGIPVMQPEKLKNPSFLEELNSFKADLQVVVAFRMLPEVVWNMPKFGTINLHGSLLPQYRGAAPINWAIINGEQKTGVTTFFIEKEIDTGNIILTEEIAITENENAGSLHDRMMWIGADLMVKTLKSIEKADYIATPQNFDQSLKPAPKIFKETCKIDWTTPSAKIHNFVRGLSPYPAAWTMLAEKQLKIYESSLINAEHEEEILKNKVFHENDLMLFSDHKNFLYARTGDGFLAILQLQLEGKKRMSTEEFLRGFRF